VTAGSESPLLRGTPSEQRTTDIDTLFERLVGRGATDAERERLYRLRQVLGLRDNDAFWSIVMALEHYDSLFRAYPEKLAEATAQAVENVRAACASAAREEVAAVQRALAERVSETSVALARKLADKPLGLHRVTMALAAIVAFGALCVQAGYELATPGRPFWMHAGAEASGACRALMSVLSVPAGWMVFALLVPCAIQGARFGWRMAADAFGDRRVQAVGWCIVLCCVLGAGACVLLLARLV
jgi:hypothetical protein